MMSEPRIRARKVIVQFLDPETPGPRAMTLMSMDEEGGIATHRNARQLVRYFKQRDELSAKRGESTATVIEWRDPPAGFEPPELGS